jgi:hypothetical protein
MAVSPLLHGAVDTSIVANTADTNHDLSSRQPAPIFWNEGYAEATLIPSLPRRILHNAQFQHNFLSRFLKVLTSIHQSNFYA